MHIFLVCPLKSQDFAQSHNNFARSHDHETVTFRNSGWMKFRSIKSSIAMLCKINTDRDMSTCLNGINFSEKVYFKVIA